MLPAPESDLPLADARRRIIVALDVESEVEAMAIADELRGSVGAFKIGLQLFTACGPRMVRRFVDRGYKIFLDLKFHDIPNTAAKASIEAAKLGVWMFNLHASGGRQMMETAVAEVTGYCDSKNRERPIMIGVTMLTSSDTSFLEEQGIAETIGPRVTRLARLSSMAGLDGVVASAQDVRSIREAVGSKKFLTVTPGIRSGSATVDDQKRVTTLSAALSAGTDYVVVGRPIIGSSDRKGAVDQMLEEISQ